MARKYVFTEIQEAFTKAGCKLLSNEYINNNQKLKYICNCGNEWSATWGLFRRGSRCRDCCNKKISNNKRTYTHQNVADYFKLHGCELITNFDGLRLRDKVQYKCKCGNLAWVIFNNFKNKKGDKCCNSCVKKMITRKDSVSSEQVYQYFKDNGCKLLEEYKNSITPVRYQCICGTTAIAQFGKFKAGQRCKKCGIEKNAKFQRRSFEKINKIFQKNKCVLITDHYENPKQKLNYFCQCGEQACKTIYAFIESYRCKTCVKKLHAKDKHYKWNPDREYIKLKNRLAIASSEMLYKCMTLTGVSKHSKTETMLGYTAAELQHTITKHENWEKVKNQEWSLDHIFPISAFVKNNIWDIKLINCLENLRPVTRKFNSSKAGRYNKQEFKEWLLTKGINLEKEIYENSRQ